MGDCALSLDVAEKVWEKHYPNCPGSYFQPVLNTLPGMMKEWEEFPKDACMSLAETIRFEMEERSAKKGRMQ